MWENCPNCNKGRYLRRSYLGRLCKSCAASIQNSGEKNCRWNGGRKYAKNGIFIFINEDHPYYAMAHKDGVRYSIAEHRLVMAQHIGRNLESWEVVHHINGNSHDNRIGNLELLPNRANHLPYNILQSQVYELTNQVDILRNRVILLEAEAVLLRVGRYDNPDLAEDEKSSGKSRDFTRNTPCGVKRKSEL